MTVQWTDEMLAALRRLREEGRPLYYCAERIGVAYPTAVYKARELGLAQRINRGRTPGTKATRGLEPRDQSGDQNAQA